jgi:hypothetical protein
MGRQHRARARSTHRTTLSDPISPMLDFPKRGLDRRSSCKCRHRQCVPRARGDRRDGAKIGAQGEAAKSSRSFEFERWAGSTAWSQAARGLYQPSCWVTALDPRRSLGLSCSHLQSAHRHRCFTAAMMGGERTSAGPLAASHAIRVLCSADEFQGSPDQTV